MEQVAKSTAFAPSHRAAKPKPVIIIADIEVGCNVHSKLFYQSETVAPI
jgi:hypothetical protein